MNILSCIGPWGKQVVTFEFDGHLSQGIAYHSTTIVMRRNAFQANRKEEVLHCRQSEPPPPSPSGKQADNTVSALQKGEELLECNHCVL